MFFLGKGSVMENTNKLMKIDSVIFRKSEPLMIVSYCNSVIVIISIDDK